MKGSRQLRAVLDTNVVFSALRYRNGPAGRLRDAWQLGTYVPLASAATVRELIRVLAYPKFSLTPHAQEDLLADYLPWTEVIGIPHPTPAIPACRDLNDIPFLHLAMAGKADALVTGDKDLLALAGSKGVCAIVTIDSFIGRLAH
jgi:putative PIN family toxin of toxin-antitoxin system